ncbi:MAG: GHMP kinase [Candidatus Latescibacterota bacterium]|nr:MAG: GHMP kinase [Candidatus Latescibacterota bacterium]
MIIRSKAPLRISFAGGGTDISPYMDEYGGIVLSATIDKCAYGSLQTRGDSSIRVQSLDYDIIAKYNLEQALQYDGELDLVKAVVNNLNGTSKTGLDFFIHSDAPPGSGLGSSSTMVVALIGLLKHWHRLPLTNYEMAQVAYSIEREELGISGGMQDQYAAVFGGFNFIEFKPAAVIVNPLRITDEIINELEYSLLLCYTGQTRLSSHIIESQVTSYEKKERSVLDAMSETKVIAIEMKAALLQARLRDFGHLMHDAWLNKKLMAQRITNPDIDALYQTARAHGALGGKILGAGGGGYLLLMCEFGRKHIIARKLEEMGAQAVDFHFVEHGLQTWEVAA